MQVIRFQFIINISYLVIYYLRILCYNLNFTNSKLVQFYYYYYFYWSLHRYLMKLIFSLNSVDFVWSTASIIKKYFKS